MGTSDRLDSWKEIAAYLKRGVRTAQRWQRAAGLPVRRFPSERGGVFAFKSEIDAWWRTQPQRGEPTAPAVEAAGRTTESAAYAAARYRSSRAAPPAPMRVRAFLSQAVVLDPDFALGHADMAVYFFTLVAMGLVCPSEGMPAARASAQRALHLDPSVGEAQAIMALVSALYDGDWQAAARRFDVALSMPVSAAVRFHHATWYLSPLGRHQEALSELHTALSEDPLYLLGRVQVAMESLSLGLEQGLGVLRSVLDIDPQFGPALGFLGREQAMRGLMDEARPLAERTYAALPQHPNAVGLMAGMERRGGHSARARALLEQLTTDRGWARPRAEAEAHLVNDDLDAAMAAVTAAIAQRDPGVWLLFTGTAGTRLRATRQWPSTAAKLKVARQRIRVPTS